MDTINLSIDGHEVKIRQGATVLEAAQAAGIYIPTLCADPDLAPFGACRLCIVEIEGMRGFPPSCTTPATDGMVVRTNSPQITWLRRSILEFLLSEHPHACLTCHRIERCGPFDICLRNVAVSERCVVCAKNKHCELQDIVRYVGLEEINLPYIPKNLPVDSSNPFFERDMNYCILCGKCVRACDEIVGAGAIAISSRGYSARISTFGDGPIVDSTCISCGECVVRCPTGALIPKNTVEPNHEVKTVCPYCGVGCSIFVGVRDNKAVSVRGDREGPANRGRLCVKGRFGITEFVNHPDRLRTPLIKKDGKFVEASWEEALDLIASKLDAYTGSEFAAISSAKCSNEDNYVMQKFARAVMGTNNVDHCARL